MWEIWFMQSKDMTCKSQCKRFPTMWYVRPAKPQIPLRIRAVLSEPFLVAWVLYECLATDWRPFDVSKLKRRLQRAIWVYIYLNATLFEISCTGSNNLDHQPLFLHGVSVVECSTRGRRVTDLSLTWCTVLCPCMALDYFQDWWAEVTNKTEKGGSFSEMMGPGISN